MKKILVIDDDPVITGLLKALLTKSGYEVFTAPNGAKGLQMLTTKEPDLVITDYEMPGMTGLEVLRTIKGPNPGLPVIMLTCHSDVSLTINSIQAGAYEYIEKPIQPQRLLEAIRNGIQLSDRARHFEEKIPLPARRIIEENFLIGLSPEIRNLVKQIGRIGMSRMHVMITGETGTGKGQVANLIHYSGVTREHPLMVVNCESIIDRNAEAELIGIFHEDAETSGRTRRGKLIEAGEGTLVINSFHLLPTTLQKKLHRIIEEKQIAGNGLIEPIPIGARVIVTSDKNPETLLSEGVVIPELYYALKVFQLHLPPLRHRTDDIPYLADYFIEKHSRIIGKNFTGMENGTMELLKKYPWPGNIKEFENAIAQAITLSRGDLLEKEHIKIYLRGSFVPVAEMSYRLSLEEVEKQYIQAVMKDVAWVKRDAAEILKITRPTLNAKIARYDLKP